ncbi:MAG TPA: two-component regulator propeller domain-containing protein [Cytophagales bacterium]|nr:two-component regulator propeller domain-containing protein [Cytophagales bacterium]
MVRFFLWVSLFYFIGGEDSSEIKNIEFKKTSLSFHSQENVFSVDKRQDSLVIGKTKNDNERSTYNLPPKIKFKQIGAQQGLSQGHGVSIFQDSEGFMWFGTMEGLNKYDGYKITVYRNSSKDSALLSNNFITCIYEDREENLWIGTRDGLDRYNRATDKFIHYKNNPENAGSISNNNIHGIYQDRKGNLWIGTNGGGLNLYHPKEDKFTNYRPDPTNPESISDSFVNCIYEDTKGNLWVGTGRGGLNLFDLSSQSFKSYKKEPGNRSSLSSNNITMILEDHEGNLWVSTWGGGLNLFDYKKNKFIHYRHSRRDFKSIGSDIIYCILEDSKGNLWVGTENGGLNLFNPDSNGFIRYTHNINDPNSLTSNTVSALHEDKSGTLWVGIHRGGINFFNIDEQKFRHYYQEATTHSLSDNNVKSFWEDKQGQVWIGTDGGGLNEFNRKTDTFKHFGREPNNPKSITSDVILSILEDSQGYLWLGTWNGGLNKFIPEENNFIHYFNQPGDSTSISSNKPGVLLEDKKGNLWIGTYDGGLNRFDKKSQKFFRFQHDPNKTNSLRSNQVRAIAKDKEGNLWIGTDKGLDFLDTSTNNFVHFKSDAKLPGSLQGKQINALLADHNDNLWVGTRHGLNFYDRKTKKFTVFSEKEGLCNNAVQGIVEDERGNLWISTLNGLSKFDPVRKVFKNFNVSDGLQGNEFVQNACLKSKNGELYFGGINGFNVFYPDSIKDNPFIPPVHLTGFELFNKPVIAGGKDSPLQQSVSQSESITLSYSQSVISFEFVALNYISPEENQYAYQLEGFDEGWNYVGNHRKATYTNLDPGQYIFKVKASNNDGIWNEQGTSIQLIITPPFWKTKWFLALSIFLTLGLVWVTVKIRTKHITGLNRKLEAKVKERTLQIEEQKQEISSHLDKLQQYYQEINIQKEELEQKVTERTQELQANNEELLLLTNALPVLITYVDQEQKYRFNNKAYEEWFGIPRAQVYGKHISTVMGKIAYEKIKGLVERALAGEALHSETWLYFPNLGNRFVSIDYIPHRQGDKVNGYYALVSDITEQEKIKQDLKNALEETQQANEELRRTNVDLDNFVYTASHDLKSPIANLEGITNFLSRKLDAKLNEEEREVLVMIHAMTTKLKATIGDLTEISKVQKDLDQAAEPIYFDCIMKDVQADLDPLIAEADAIITTNWEEKEIYYARKNLRSIFYNLIGNALKYRSPDRTLQIFIRTYREGNEIVLIVRDNGLGMAPFQVSKLFTMFKRFHTHVEGTGIGLYIIKRIIENYGGRIEVETELNKGTEFKVYFRSVS